MLLTRRELTQLVSAIAATVPSTLALQAGQTAAATDVGGSQAIRYEDLTPTRSGPGASRQMLRTRTHSGYRVDMHETELPASMAPHPPHQHVHEEMMLIREGTMEVTIAGTTTRLGPGSFAYVASNQMHGWRNVGTVTARYFVLALGEDNA